MIVLKSITTALIVVMMLIIALSMRGENTKDTMLGFWLLIVTYVLSLICMWA